MPDECSQSIGLPFLATETSENLPPPSLEQMEFPWMSSAEASPARTSAQQEKAPGSLASVRDYGRNTPVLLASYDQPTSSWRTSQHFLGEGLERFSETWPRSGTMRSGIAYRLPPLVPLTGGTASGLWPTPTLGGGGQTLPEGTTPTGQTPNGRKKTVCLQRYVLQVDRGIWPTPTVQDAHGRDRHNQKNGGVILSLLGQARMRPTPTRGAAMCKWGGAGSRAKLRTMISSEELNGALNPTWVEWLMGFPPEWTALDASATPSSRKSRK
jgi:hypothetical protein